MSFSVILQDPNENLANKGQWDSRLQLLIGQCDSRLWFLIGQWDSRLLCQKSGLYEAHRVARGEALLFG